MRLSFRQDADMAGAIFMCNTWAREQFFGSGIFRLALEYQPFVDNVKQGMPLFLFDYNERKLYGVFEAVTDGGLDITDRAAFRSTGRSYPAQVRFKIIWKCRPLAEDEFSHAIKENYYTLYKFYFDLSYQQVVKLYELFDNKRVEQPIRNYTISAHSKEGHFSKGRPDKRSLNPNISPLSTDQSHTLILTAGTKYSAPTSMCGTVPHNFEARTNLSMPSVSKPVGVQIDPINNSHHVQKILPYHNNSHLQDVSTVDGISTQVYAPYCQTNGYHQDQFVTNQSYPISDDYMHSSLSSRCMTASPTDGIRSSVKQSYVGSTSRSLQHITQASTGGDRNYVNSTPNVPSYHFSLANPQCSANLKDSYDIDCHQCKEIHTSEHQHLRKERAQIAPVLIQHGIPACPEVPEVSTIGQREDGFSDYIPIADCAQDFDNDWWKHGSNHSISGSLENVIGSNMSDQLHTNREIAAESNTTIVPGQHSQNSVFSRLSSQQQPLQEIVGSQNNVFSRLSPKQQPLQEITGPSLSQILNSLSKRTEQWSSGNRTHSSQNRETRSENMTLISQKREDRDTYDAGKQLAVEQSITCPLAELNLPNVEGKESVEPPFLNFKRRSETAQLDGNLGKETIGKMKRRKLVRSSFGENNNPTDSGKEIQVNGAKDRKHPHFDADGNKFSIDLNKPASTDTGLLKEDGSTILCPVDINIQTEKLCEVNTAHKLKFSDAMGLTGKQDHPVENAAQTGKVSLDLNDADLNTMDESKLRAILDSPWLQALDKLRNVKSNNSEVASSLHSNDNTAKMEINPYGSI
ncbi:hypothetical protein D1007_52209 [Hordeum vulgare]|nr:hypothetical protein D1007_52209 [Hordeum vulgare]